MDRKNNMAPPTMTLPEVAEYLGVSESFCYQRFKTLCRPIKVARRLRWFRTDIDRYLEGLRGMRD